MPRTKGSKNKPKLEELDKMETNIENFVRIQTIRNEYVERIKSAQAELERIDSALVRFAGWMEHEAKRLRSQAKASSGASAA